MKFKALLGIALVLMMAFVVVAPADDSDATVTSMTIEGGDVIKLDKSRGGTLVINYVADENKNTTVRLIDTTNNNVERWSDNIMIKSTDEGKIEIPLDTDNYPSGSVRMKVTFENAQVYSDLYFKIEYTTSIWSNWTTYVAIIVVIILIAALVLYKSRAAPKEKNQLTFEEIEAQKQAQKAAVKEEKPTAAKSERQRYLASKKK